MEHWRTAVWGRPNELLNTTVAAVERLGVLVIQTARVQPSEMQGFSISERPYPVIALNGKDPPRRKLFTLLHELCHIVLNVGGVCEPLEGSTSPEPGNDVEIFCNRVAAAVLLPRQQVLEHPLVRSVDRQYPWSLAELFQLSQHFGPSSEAILLRLIALDKATWQLYEKRKAEFEREYWSKQQEGDEPNKKGGPNYYTLKVRNMGREYISCILEAYRNSAISSRDVANYLDIRYEQLGQMERRVS
jgi:Zn-dependent peptidase ImmA (M78 family)